MPPGRRIAYDPVLGRLWAVCEACHRWNLCPIEERDAALYALERMARDKGRLDEPAVRQRLAWAHTQVEIMRYLGLRTLTGSLRGHNPGPESSIHKLIWSEYHNRVTELAVDIIGADAMTPSGREAAYGISTDAPGSPYSSRGWVSTFLGARPGTIYAGTSQIQKNILGDRVLGLPREPRMDEGPWSQSRS